LIRTSETLTELATALSAAQGEFETVSKTADNPFFKSKYADLAAVVKAASPILAKHGLSVVQLPGYEDGVDVLTTRLLHSSGEWIESTGRMLLTKQDSQGWGSAVTYARRYSYSAALGLVTEVDDDGNAASAPAPARTTTRQAPQQQAPRQEAPAGETAADPNLASAKQIGMLNALFNRKGIGDDHMGRMLYCQLSIKREPASLKELSKKEASLVIDALMAEPDDA
jgi:hypothetical protein